MAKIHINDTALEVSRSESGHISINNEEVNYDLITISKGNYHLLLNDISYRINVLDKDGNTGAITFLVNGREFKGKLGYKIEELLRSMGMETGKRVLKELKAPMPGLVLDVLVSDGQEVKEGDDLLILEAMKMENAIKSPQDGTIDHISVTKQDKVDKNEILVTFK